MNITRTKYISFRVSSLEKKAIELAAEETNLSTSSFARRASLNMKVRLRFSPGELEIYKDLHKYHNNFSYIGNLIKGHEENKEKKILQEIETVKSLIRDHLKRFKI